MRIHAAALSAIFLATSCASTGAQMATNDDKAAATIPVMVVGAFHMGNPGQDVANAEIESMLTDKRQREIADVAEALREFRPTVVVVERLSDAPDYIDQKYQAFAPAQLRTIADERYQIAYRIANLEGLDRVYGIDEQPEGDEPDYFPFDKLYEQAVATGQKEKFDSEIAVLQAATARFESLQKDHSVADLLVDLGREITTSNADFHYALSEFDRGERQAGAELQAYWFMRNAKIFSKLMQVTKPGDRVIVVYGAGHKYWLDHFARHTPGFEETDVFPYLEKAAARR